MNAAAAPLASLLLPNSPFGLERERKRTLARWLKLQAIYRLLLAATRFVASHGLGGRWPRERERRLVKKAASNRPINLVRVLHSQGF
jgi:hypothetical protein